MEEKNRKRKIIFDNSKRKQSEESVRKIEANRRRKNDVNEETLTKNGRKKLEKEN